MSFFLGHSPMQRFLPILFWGGFGGIFLAVAMYIIEKTLTIVTISCYSFIASQVFWFWKPVTILLLSFTLGMIFSDLFSRGRIKGPGPILVGAIYGTCSTLVAFILVEIYPLLSSLLRHPVSMAGTFATILVVYILVITLPCVLGAWFFRFITRTRQGSDDTSGPAKNESRYRPWYFFVALCTLLFMFPLGLLALPVDTTDYFACPEGMTCTAGHQCGTGRPPDNVTVSRAGPDSIRISLDAGSAICGSQNTFGILLNGIDVSNQAAVSRSGLALTITPSEGLGRVDGAFMLLQGRDVVANESAPPRIQVIITDRSATWIHRDLLL